MKLVHSFWSKPSLSAARVSGGRRDGGWLRSKYQFYSYALSCLRGKETFGAIDLVTDRLGKEMMIDALKLPYRKVDVLLDDLNDHPAELWAMGKLYAYAIQREPFLHIDNDIFLWKKFAPDILNSQLVAQNAEYNLGFYSDVLQVSTALDVGLPEFIQCIDRKAISSSNAGVIGGKAQAFFLKLMKVAFDFVESNRDKLLKSKNPSLFNVLFEQLFYHQLAIVEGLPIKYIFGSVNPKSRDMVYFHRVPSGNSYIHVFGNSLKQDALVASKVEHTLKLEFPQYYYRANSLMKEFQI